ncbi:MAG TPA: hypothetical protein VK892_07725 [Pyrinomonadaceae bacterium]|nr:hypothetical protein [Pyrinomonadaceae bacterium]
MDDEKINRTIEIILQQRAQFYADLQEMKEVQKEAEKRVNVLERVSLNLYNTTVEQGKNIAQLTEDVKELRAAQKETDERLNAVIVMAEKFFSRNNGDSEKK